MFNTVVPFWLKPPVSGLKKSTTDRESKLFPPCPPRFSCFMPVVQLVRSYQVQSLARRWGAANPTRDPEVIPLEERLGSVKARMAFCLAHRIKWACQTGRAPPSMCDTCGKPTFSWCEACYARLGGTSTVPYSGLCQECDKERRVCHLCFGQQVSWTQGHQEYVQVNGPETDAGVEVTAEDGVSTVRVTFEELSRRLGRPAADIREEISQALAAQDDV